MATSFILERNSKVKTPPAVTLDNITLSSSVWEIQGMKTQISACNISNSQFIFTPLFVGQDYGFKFLVYITKTQIGKLTFAYTSAHISHSEVLGPLRLTKGGTILSVNSSVELYKVAFKLNQQDEERVFYATSGSHVEMSQCIFFKNSVHETTLLINGSSKMFATDCHFVQNAGTSSGAVSINGGSYGTFAMCNFSSNQAGSNGGSGGAISVIDNSHIHVSKSFFTENNACYGGSIYVGFNSSMTVEKSVFNNNTARCTASSTRPAARIGAAIAAMYYAHVHISNSSFTANYACMGGGIYVRFNSTMTVEKSIFSHNSATGPYDITVTYN